MLKAKRTRDPRGGQMDTAIAMRGDRHKVDLWAKLLPSARAKLVTDGLFTTDGKITAKGLDLLNDKMN